MTIHLSPYEIIVPRNSITNSDEDNIAALGPMQGKNTSFRIPNGTIDQFQEALSKMPASNLLEVQFYDNGYEHFAVGMNNVHLIGLMLFCVGLAMSIAIISLMLYFNIVKQHKRTAIERALGMTRRQCVISLIAGILVLMTLGAVSGCIVGTTIGSVVQDKVLSDSAYFSSDYSRGLVQNNRDSDAQSIDLFGGNNQTLSLIAVAGVLLFVFVLSLMLIRNSLAIAPICLLSTKDNE